MKILYLPQEQDHEIGTVLSLPREDSHHITHVLRLPAGARLAVSDGRQWVYTAELMIESAPKRVALRLLKRSAIDKPRHRLHLHLSPVPKPIAEDLLRRAAEWGITSLEWTLYERSEIFWEYAKVASRFEKVTQEAIKSTGRPLVPTLTSPILFREAMAHTADAGLHLFGHIHPQGAQTLAALDLVDVADCHLWIGPQGDFTQHERETMTAAGYVPITLGRYIYRIESAAAIFIIQLQSRLAGL